MAAHIDVVAAGRHFLQQTARGIAIAHVEIGTGQIEAPLARRGRIERPDFEIAGMPGRHPARGRRGDIGLSLGGFGESVPRRLSRQRLRLRRDSVFHERTLRFRLGIGGVWRCDDKTLAITCVLVRRRLTTAQPPAYQ